MDLAEDFIKYVACGSKKTISTFIDSDDIMHDDFLELYEGAVVKLSEWD
jgi:hypothetical protein